MPMQSIRAVLPITSEDDPVKVRLALRTLGQQTHKPREIQIVLVGEVDAANRRTIAEFHVWASNRVGKGTIVPPSLTAATIHGANAIGASEMPTYAGVLWVRPSQAPFHTDLFHAVASAVVMEDGFSIIRVGGIDAMSVTSWRTVEKLTASSSVIPALFGDGTLCRWVMDQGGNLIKVAAFARVKGAA